MKNNTWIIIGIVVLGVIGLGVYASVNTKKDITTNVMTLSDDQVMVADDQNKEADQMMQKDETASTESADVMIEKGSYETYSPEKIAMKASNGNVVLFFKANWCPTCRALDADIKANLNNIPGNLTVLEVDYDNSTALKQKYGVTVQHTLVEVDKDGNLIKKWSGSPTLVSLVAQVK